MNKLRGPVLLFVLLLCGGLVNPQESNNLRFDRLASENIRFEKGLSQNTIHSILQDNQGYMWFGTWDGLNKYDGYHFEIFKPDLFNKGVNLSNQVIYALYEDENGLIWIGTEAGLNCYDRRQRQFTLYSCNSRDPLSIASDTINAICGGTGGRIWLGTQNGLSAFDPKSGRSFNYRSRPGSTNTLSNNVVHTIFRDREGILWLGTDGGLNRFNPASGKFTVFRKSASGQGISSDTVQSICQDSKGYFWIGTQDGLNRYDPANGTFAWYFHDPRNPGSLNSNVVYDVLEDSYGMLWVGTYGAGLDLLDREHGRFIHYHNLADDQNSLSNDYVNAIYEDKSGNLWIGTAWKGVNKIDRFSNQFRHYYHVADNNKSLNDNLVWALYEDEDRNVWICTDQGINLYHHSTGTYEFITSHPSDPNSLPSNRVMCMYRDPGGLFWFGTFDAGLVSYDHNTKRFTRYQHNPSDPSSISHNNISAILRDPEGNLWVGTLNGLNKLIPESRKFKVYLNNPSDPNSLSGNNIASLYVDRKGTLWVCSYNGLMRYNREHDNFTAYYHDPDNSNSLSTNKIFAVYEDGKGIYWITTMGGGLNRYDPSSGQFKVYTEQDGLPNNVVYSILDDGKGNFWISTNFGLTKFILKNETFVNYDVKDGIQSNEFNLGAAFMSHSGEMFFGGMNGFNAFYPREINKNTHVPPIVITSFNIFNEPQPRELRNGDTIRLNFRNNFFSFEFSALDFTRPSKNKYRYFLEHFDKTWISTDAETRFAEYKEVNPGTYTFRVIGSNSDGIWNEEGVTLTIIITPPWWGIWYFRTGFLLVLVFLIWWIIFWRTRRVKRRHAEAQKMLDIEKQLFDLEQKALRLQMNPHFIFNSLNSIQSFILTNDTDKAINYLAKFSHLMRLILTNSREAYIPVGDEIKAINYYLELEKLRFDDKFEYVISIDPDIDQEFMEIPPMVIQPYIENAIIHGLIHKEGTGLVDISAELRDNSIFWVISDNGIGREQARKVQEGQGLKRKSRGMLITRERLEILNRQNNQEFSVNVIDLFDEAGQPAGTRVEINLYYRET